MSGNIETFLSPPIPSPKNIIEIISESRDPLDIQEFTATLETYYKSRYSHWKDCSINEAIEKNIRELFIAAIDKDNLHLVKQLTGRVSIGERFEGDRYNRPFTLFSKACSRKNREIIEFLLNQPDTPLSFPPDKPPLVHLLEAKHYDLAKEVWSKTGMNEEHKAFFRRLYPIVNVFIAVERGLPYDQLISEEINRILEAGKGEIFDQGFLDLLSDSYQNFWIPFSHGKKELNDAEFYQSLWEFCGQEGKYPGNTRALLQEMAGINFLLNQYHLHQEMCSSDKMHHFPIAQLWRFAVDAHAEVRGCCVFEDQPGYVKSFFAGFIHALQTKDAPKTPEWYKKLHSYTLGSVYRSTHSDSSKSLLNTTGDQCLKGGVLRNQSVFYPINANDQDPVGFEDLQTRDGSSSYQFSNLSHRPDVFIVDYEDWVVGEGKVDHYGQVWNRLNLVFNQFNKLLPKASTPAQKLLVFLRTARELEIEHVFTDANTRASHLAFLSMIAGEPELPMCLFPDSNVLDANGPESAVYRYLEGCVNFRQGGIGHNFKKEKTVKKLDSLPLDGHEDLIALRENLRPLVENKTWKQLFESS